jgi:hypothetical protein
MFISFLPFVPSSLFFYFLLFVSIVVDDASLFVGCGCGGCVVVVVLLIVV